MVRLPSTMVVRPTTTGVLPANCQLACKGTEASQCSFTGMTEISTTAHADTRRSWIPEWEPIGLAVLLVATGVAYLWNLSVNGWANSFYAAAVQSGAKSWKAFFFGSSDWANSITVDKTPASLWPMEISVRIFGMHSWSMLMPQVLLGLASVALLWATLRRTHGPAAGLIGGLLLAVTPVAILMFRYNNPDALLVFLMIAAVWAMTRALADGRWRWLVLCGAFVGVGFLAKQLQVLLVVPALALAYLFAGPPRLGKRIFQLLAAGAAMIAGAGWWVLTAQLWPASSRPYFGGSQHNSIIELTLGYNGLDRLGVGSSSTPRPAASNSDTPSGPPMGGPGADAGIARLFNDSIGGQIAWLIPAALLMLAAGVILRGKASRTDPQRAALILWGGWGLVTGLVFSFMKGIFHEYYTVALAPAVAGVVGIGAAMLWPERERLWCRGTLAATVALTTITSVVLLSRSHAFVPGLRWFVLAAGTLAALAILVPQPRRLSAVTVVAAIVAATAGPAAYSAQTIATGHHGGIVQAGPQLRKGWLPSGTPGGAGSDSSGGAGHSGATPNAAEQAPYPPGGDSPWRPSEALVALLRANASRYTWAAATVGSTKAADLQLPTGYPVMPIGGFGGGDPAPTLEQFQRFVAEEQIHYFVPGDGPGWTEDRESGKITRWVRDNFTSTEVDGQTVYDLTTG